MSSIQTIFNNPCSITYLLPYFHEFRVTSRQQKRNELILIRQILEISATALKSFLEGNVIDFDAQVGENLCQIRAYKNINLAKFWLNDQNNKSKFINLICIIDKLRITISTVIQEWEKSISETKQYDRNLDGYETIEDLIKRLNLYLEFPTDIAYIISCYFLTHFAIRNDNVPVAINFKNITAEFNVSKHRAERLVHRYQLIVTKLGCDFIMKIAAELPTAEIYANLLPKLHQLSDVDRYVLPCHVVSEIILEHCNISNIPILFLLNRNKLLKQELIYFLIIESAHIDSNNLEDDYCLVILGDNYSDIPSSKQYLRYLKDLNLMDLVLANTAMHPQYSGNKLMAYRDDPFQSLLSLNSTEAIFFSQRIQELKRFAYKHGCYKDNPKDFFLKHIYASKLYFEKNRLKYHERLVISDINRGIGNMVSVMKDVVSVNIEDKL